MNDLGEAVVCMSDCLGVNLSHLFVRMKEVEMKNSIAHRFSLLEDLLSSLFIFIIHFENSFTLFFLS